MKEWGKGGVWRRAMGITYVLQTQFPSFFSVLFNYYFIFVVLFSFSSPFFFCFLLSFFLSS